MVTPPATPPQDANPARRTASDLLFDAVRACPDERVTLEALTGALGDRAFGVAMLLFALPSCLPVPPGLNSVFGLPLFLYGLQLAAGRRAPWQPGFLARRTFPRATLERMLIAAAPLLRRVERLCRPRLPAVTSGAGERLLGVEVALLALCIMVPLWGTNFIPALGAALIAIALLEHDGIVALAGALVGLAGILLTLGVFWGFLAALRLAL